MTLAEKFAGLTPEQKEKLAAVKTAGELVAFLAENKIELTAEERKFLATDGTALSDDEMAAVAGGMDFNIKGSMAWVNALDDLLRRYGIGTDAGYQESKEGMERMLRELGERPGHC